MESESGVLGRGGELSLLEKFLVAEADLPAGLVLEGEAGIGKTTLWREGVAVAEARGYRVLVCSPGGSEARLAYGSVGDLLAGVAEVVAELPAPQRRALNVALLVEDPEPGAPEWRPTAVGLLNVLRALARASPVLVAVDDVQWLDAESAAAIAFAARRLRGDRVRFLIARRADSGGEELERALPPARLMRVDLAPLSLGAIHQLVKQRLGETLPRPALHRLQETSGGNPFFALELARVLVRRGGSIAPGEELPVPGELRDLVAERIAELPASTIEVLGAASAVAAPTLDLLTAATDTASLEALDPALEADVVELRDDGRVVFAHPLFASAVYSSLQPGDRRRLHASLARVVAEPEQRARHAALAAEGPDATVADLLDEAADTASARGAPAAAAELIDLAIRLTPSDDPRARNRRRLRASDLHGAVGSRARSEALLVELQSDPLTSAERAQVLMRQAAWQGVSSAIGLYEAAIPDAAGDSKLEGELEHYLGFDLAFIGRLDDGRAHLKRAVELLEDTGGPLLAEVLAGLVLLEMYAAEPIPDQLLDRALALEQAFGGPPRLRSPAKVAAIRLMREGRVDAARVFLDGFTARTVAYGDEALHVNALRMQVELECRAGRFDVAAALVAELTELADQIGQPLEALHPSALVAAYRGPVDEARRLALQLADVARERDIQWEVVTAESIVGFIDLSAGDAPAAWRVLEPLPGMLDAMGYRETGGLPPLYVNAVEAAVGVGELEAARGLADILEQRAARTNSPATSMAAARSAALVAAAAGAGDDAVAAFTRALEVEERAPAPFERARVLLALGTVQRRGKRWAEARHALEEATAIFERVSTPLWAERARQEIARVPGRAPAGDELTPTELRVAALVAEGRANKEVAAELFVTVHAVEANLTRIYRKLGIRSRSELARRFAELAAPTNL